ncbi:DNA-directed DNA/RNA polymerase mu [Danio rerio]|uniref:DNA-directed DNA/RNA polymerase mu n=1 Tax=Danio rerio TaxID=7955 RepID=Q7ZUU0_DANRE|nr:DNA-directed DNA/RNA polymerase mu [Danio rerio]AAH47832.1 Polymerase (DNA directed), mu [Danio rerio]AAI65363.1 Polm protein [Danio rerio]|eukprot:NP_956542.1 DNA-directed DNA/RNA polymerase mu [Danio rerio]
MIPLKRRKVSVPVKQQTGSCKYPQVCIFILERKMGASRRAFLTRLGRSKGFLIEDSYSSSVTHVVSENSSAAEVQAWLEKHTRTSSSDHLLEKHTHAPSSSSVHLLDICWFTESMEAGEPVPVQHTHTLQINPELNGDGAEILMKSYACQRRTPLKHHNAFLTEALEILAQNAEFNDNEGRSVAFRRAASVLKALPHRVKSMEDLRCLPCLGDHSQRVIKEILEDGSSREVESTRQSEQFQAMKALTGVFGVGVRTADRWIREGLRTPDDLIRTGQQLNRAQQAGVQYYSELQRAVTRAEAELIMAIVEAAVNSVLPGCQIQLMGGFRRGKEVGHDVDFLITHPEEGKEEGLMSKIISWLEEQGVLLYQKTTRNSYVERLDGPARSASNMDRFERCFSIFKLHSSASRSGSASTSESGSACDSGCRAVRVDLVVSPFSQFAFATLGWTGSKLFERELRRWAGQEKQMTLSSHTLYDSKQNLYLRAQTEEEIFAHLGLEFIPPSERNA